MPSSTRLRMRRVRNEEVWLANLNPGKGSEPGKVRPSALSLNLQSQAFACAARLEVFGDIRLDDFEAALLQGGFQFC